MTFSFPWFQNKLLIAWTDLNDLNHYYQVLIAAHIHQIRRDSMSRIELLLFHLLKLIHEDDTQAQHNLISNDTHSQKGNELISITVCADVEGLPPATAALICQTNKEARWDCDWDVWTNITRRTWPWGPDPLVLVAAAPQERKKQTDKVRLRLKSSTKTHICEE